MGRSLTAFRALQASGWAGLGRPTQAHAMGLHVRCGIEDNLWNQSRTAKMSTVEQIEQLVRISREFGREIATGKEAREILKIGVFYNTVEEAR